VIRHRLAIVATHPIQYYAPWFRHISRHTDSKVFYLWDPRRDGNIDPGFARSVEWDLPLLEGYESEWVPNIATRPGTHHFAGIRNPELRSRLKAWEPDAVLLMAYNYLGLIPFIEGWRSCPLLFRGDSHRLVPQTGWKSAARLWLTRRIFRRFAACLYVGEANKAYYRHQAVTEEKLFFSPHAVDNDRWQNAAHEALLQADAWRSGHGIPPDAVVFLFAGKFIAKKNPDRLVRAFHRLEVRAGQSPPWLVIAGDGPMRSEVQALVGTHPRIMMMPFHNQTEMPALLAKGDVVVLPSEGPGETWGLIINEAQNLSRAVLVSSHVGCAADLVREGAGGCPGLIYTDHSDEGLAEAMQQLAFNRERCRVMGEAGRARVSGYNYDRATNGLLEALRYVTGEGR
jgi:glycosyltransferase involved in cell wall biosynthesis